MKKFNLYSVFVFSLICFSLFSKPDLSNIKHPLPFNKVVIWGHKLHTHTHSYIHYAFYRAFKHLGYDTLWLDNSDDISKIDFSNSLFLTEGQVDQKMPIRDDCKYILHFCNPDKYKKLLDKGNCINLEIYKNTCIEKSEYEVERCIYVNLKNKIIYMYWGTDLLPYEIDAIKKQVAVEKKEKIACFIGSINNSGETNNESRIKEFERACQENGIKFMARNFDWNSRNNISPQENIRFVRQALLAPSIQGPYQCRVGYIPCRIFKNISYGAIGITNSKEVYELFDKKILYDEDTYKLGLRAIDKMKNFDINELYELMDFVRDNHTYINRINYLLWFMDLVKPL